MNAPALIPVSTAQLPRTYEAGAGVYMVMDDSGRIKIGVTSDIAQRISGLQTGSSSRLSLIRFFPGAGPRIERWLHKKFKDFRLHGEWFRFDDQMLTIRPPDEATSTGPTVVVRRDIRLTAREKLKVADESADLIGLTGRERLMVLVQHLDDAEADLLCEEIRAFIKARALAGAA